MAMLNNQRVSPKSTQPNSTQHWAKTSKSPPWAVRPPLGHAASPGQG